MRKTERDHGTPELRARRLAALGPRRKGWPEPDPAAAESALGVLLWQGYLHPDWETAKRMHDAGVQFAGWWLLVHPNTLQGTLGRFVAGGSAEVDTDTAERNLRASERLMARERQVLDAVINAAVYQRVSVRRLDKLRIGLQWLVASQSQNASRRSPTLMPVQSVAPSLGYALPA